MSSLHLGLGFLFLQTKVLRSGNAVSPPEILGQLQKCTVHHVKSFDSSPELAEYIKLKIQQRHFLTDRTINDILINQ
jgi:hypothetical protein